ncbi:MAG: WYL domain-containing protein, partial [Rubrivivax sp.]
QRRRVWMRYFKRSDRSTSEREVSPQRLVNYRNTWYLDAWCHSRERLLRFALDAVEDAHPLDSKAKEVALRQVEAQMDAGYGIYAGGRRHWATLLFEPQAAQWVSKEQWHPEQRARWLAQGEYELSVPYTDETEIVMDILRHGDQVRVVAPDALAHAVATRLRAAALRY